VRGSPAGRCAALLPESAGFSRAGGARCSCQGARGSPAGRCAALLPEGAGFSRAGGARLSRQGARVFSRAGGAGFSCREVRGSPDNTNAPLAPRRLIRLSGPTVRSGRPRRRRNSAGADPLRYRCFLCFSSCSPWPLAAAGPPFGTVAMNLAPLKSRRTPVHEHPFMRTSARLRTPRRCWREYVRAH
jgi:hypothetical protein